MGFPEAGGREKQTHQQQEGQSQGQDQPLTPQALLATISTSTTPLPPVGSMITLVGASDT